MRAERRVALHNAPGRRSDYPLPGNPGYDAFLRDCRRRHDANADRWWKDRQGGDRTLGEVIARTVRAIFGKDDA